MQIASTRDDSAFERRTTEFGRKIFGLIGEEQPSAFNKNFWSGKLMAWSMKRPELKVNLFRLVDVLPTLKTSEAVARHLREYLGDVVREIHPLLGFGVSVPPSSLRAKLVAFAVRKGVEQMAQQFIAGASPDRALGNLRSIRKRGLAFTVDLLGEYCVSEREAKAYLDRYLEALEVFGKHVPGWKESSPLVEGHPGEQSPVCVSVKLSALYSQCSPLNFDRTVSVLSERLSLIVRAARKVGGLVYVDAEDSGTNGMVYAAYKRVFGGDEFRDFPYPGIVVQAYAKESGAVVEDLLEFARERGGPIAVRLVKGAYWDQERILCAQQGWPSPLYSVKESSDANYEALSRRLLDEIDHVLPAFGSHNIRSLAHACMYADRKGIDRTRYELQMLYGMADPIAQAFSREGFLTRLYVPLGEMLPGMGYLVRRLLENTSNESFLRHTFFDAREIDRLLRAPKMRDGETIDEFASGAYSSAEI